MADTHGTVFWTELMTGDLEAAKRYYAEVCGWSFETFPMGPGEPDYTLGFRNGRPVVGLLPEGPAGGEGDDGPRWMSYFAVDDVDGAVEQTRAAGGHILRPPFVVPGTGRIAIVRDPTGAVVGLMTPEPMDAD